jgi:hypothetical protein
MRILIGLCLAAVSGFPAAQPDRPLPLFFFPNAGQTDPSVQYIVQTPDLSARFRSDSAIFQVRDRQTTVRFAGADPGVSLGGIEPLAAKVNFFLGNDGWKKDVPSYSKVIYRGLYPGIDMTYGGTGRQVKSEFLVAPRANPSLIRLEYSEPVSIDDQGNLLVGRDFREAAPEIYQQIGSRHVAVAGRYRVLDAHTVGFEIDSYDVSEPLVIDPTISYATYLGGSGVTAITGLAVDANANLYVTGWTAALNFPINGAVQAANQGGDDIIVAKLNPAGTGLLYATYIGGRGNDQAAAIAVDSLGQAYVTGSTSSSNFPLVLSNRGGLGGTTTAFALKLNATGNTLLYCGYLGGTVTDGGAAIAVDANANAYISGTTQSSNFPTMNAPQPAFGGGVDVFVTKLNAAGTIAFSTFLGGSGNEEAGGIALDSVGNIFVAGGTSSANFPTVAALQSAISGSQDAFVTKISFNGTISFSTYLGGNGGAPQQASAIAVDTAGNPYVTGVTNSTNFPVTAGALQTTLIGLQNAFVTRLSSSGVLAYSTYLGGSSFDWGYSIAVSAAGNAYVAGNTSSVDFPQVGAVQAAFNGAYDAFVSELNFGGTALLFSTYYGGSGSEAANAIALDKNANIFVGGQTSSSNLALVSPIQSSTAASSTGWLLRLGVTALPGTTPSVVSVSPTSGSGNSVTFTARYSDTGGGQTLTTAALLVNTTTATNAACYVNYNPASNLFSIFSDAGTAVAATVTPGSGSGQNSQCVLSGVGSSATVSGSTLTVTFILTFQLGFTGAKNVYLEAVDANANTGWVAEGTFTTAILPGVPQAVSVTPNAASGSAQTFVAVFSNTVAATNLTNMSLLFNTGQTGVSACYFVYTFPANTVSLATDNGLSTTSAPLGSTTTLQNSQCAIGGATATISGLTITFSITITFKPTFNGLKTIFMDATTSSSDPGFVAKGTYNINSGGSPVAMSVVPNAGSGPGERFTFILSDVGGASFINSGAFLFASTFNLVNACYVIWDGTHNTISVTFDNPANGQTPVTPGLPGIATNDECTLNGANSTILVSFNQVIITVEMTFNSTFAGPKTIFLLGAEGTSINSGWTAVGSWTVTGGASTANSVSPNSGAGSTQTFLLTVSDSSSQTNISGMQLLLTTGAPSAIANACYVVYNRINATVGLWDNTGNTTLTTKGIGSSANVLNNQCAIGSSVMNVIAGQIQLSVQLVFFKPAFTGLKSVYLNATEPTSSSGFVYQGTWTVQ